MGKKKPELRHVHREADFSLFGLPCVYSALQTNNPGVSVGVQHVTPTGVPGCHNSQSHHSILDLIIFTSLLFESPNPTYIPPKLFVLGLSILLRGSVELCSDTRPKMAAEIVAQHLKRPHSVFQQYAKYTTLPHKFPTLG